MLLLYSTVRELYAFIVYHIPLTKELRVFTDIHLPKSSIHRYFYIKKVFLAIAVLSYITTRDQCIHIFSS